MVNSQLLPQARHNRAGQLHTTHPPEHNSGFDALRPTTITAVRMMSWDHIIASIIVQLIQQDLNSQMQPLSPFRVNLPQYTTSPINQKQHKYSASQLALARGHVLALKDDNQLEQALAQINVLINQRPEDIRNYQIKGELAYQLKMYGEALATYDQLLALTTITQSKQLNSHLHSPTLKQLKKCRALYYYNKALCLQKMQRYCQAIQIAKKSINLNKNKAQTYVCLGECYKMTGQMDKVGKIYDKLVEKYPENSAYLMRAVKISKEDKDYEGVLKYAEKGIGLWNDNTKNKNKKDGETVLVSLYTSKGQALVALNRHQQAIAVYTHLLTLNISQPQLLLIYSQIALCYDYLNNPDRATTFYQKMLRFQPRNLSTINNLANLMIRNRQAQAAAQLLTDAIENKVEKQENYSLGGVVLRCHRVIALTQMGQFSKAAQDLSEIQRVKDKAKGGDGNRDNYRFVGYIISKYKTSISQLSLVKQEEFKERKEQVVALQKELVMSIEQDLNRGQHINMKQNKEKDRDNVKIELAEQNGVNLEKLEQRIDRLYGEIITLKNKTIVQHEQNAQKVHKRIDELTHKLTQKQQQSSLIQSQLKQLRLQNKQIYDLVQSHRAYPSSRLSAALAHLRTSKESAKAQYLQQMYWVMNSYLIAVRLIANRLVVGQKGIHSNGVSAFFGKFKGVFSALSHVPYIGCVCEGITILMGFYLSEQSQNIYGALNQIITRNYYLQRDLQTALQQALVTLSKGTYIQNALKQQKMHQMSKDVSMHSRAYSWFRGKKKQLVDKVVRIEGKEESKQDRMVEELVVEDISTVLVHLVKNRHKIEQKHPQTDILSTAIQHSLTLQNKHRQIQSLYARDKQKSTLPDPQAQGCTKCMIYTASVPDHLPQIEPTTNQVMDSLMADAIEKGDCALFGYALGRMIFDFQF